MKKFRISILFLSLMTILSFTFYHVEASRVAVIKNITGDVYIKKGGGKKEFKAKEGMSLSQGDSVRTIAKSSANISYEDGSKTTVSSNSKLTISKLKENNSGKQIKVKVVSGKVWNSVKNLSNSNDEYDVETPTAIMGVRGTHFLVYTDPITGRSTVAVLDGTVGVTQNSDSGSSSSSTTNSQPQETLVTVNQTLDTRTVAQPLPEAQTLDVKQLIQQVEPQVIVEMIQDLTQTIKETNEQAKSTQQLFEQTKQQDLIKQAIELSKTASAIANIQDSVLKEINQSTVKTEIERLLETQYNQTLENITKQNNDLKTETRNTEQQVTNAAKEAGMTQEQVDSYGPKTTTPTAPAQQNGSSNGGSTTPASPIGVPVAPVQGVPLVFSNGLSMDFGSHSIGTGITVTVEEKQNDPQVLNKLTGHGKNLNVAGKIIEFTIKAKDQNGNDVEIDLNQPVEIKIPISTTNTTDVGIFYLNNAGNWEYQPTTISSDGKYAITTVHHFSTYGVLEAEETSSPKAKVGNEFIDPSNVKIVDSGIKISLESDTQNAKIFYQLSDSTTIQEYSETNKPEIGSGKVIIKTYAKKDNLRDSSESTYTFITHPLPPNVTADDQHDILIGADDTMEYSFDQGQSWISYLSSHPPTFYDNLIVMVRVKANGEIPVGHIKTVTFTKESNIDTTAPTFDPTDVYVTPDNYFIVIPFNENIHPNALPLRDKIKIAYDGITFVDLGIYDNVMIGTEPGHEKRLIIHLANKLTGAHTKVKILADSVKDGSDNVQSEELITDTLVTNNNGGKPVPPYITGGVDGEDFFINVAEADTSANLKLYDASDDSFVDIPAEDYRFMVPSNGARYYVTQTVNGIESDPSNIIIVPPFDVWIHLSSHVENVNGDFVFYVNPIDKSNNTLEYYAPSHFTFGVYDDNGHIIGTLNVVDVKLKYNWEEYYYEVTANFDRSGQFVIKPIVLNVPYEDEEHIEFIEATTPPDTINNLTFEANNDTITLNWLATNNANIYKIFVNGDEETAYWDETISNINYTINNLTPGNNYNIRLEAWKLDGHSPEAVSYLNVITEDLPKLENVEIYNLTTSSFYVSWDPVIGSTGYTYSLNNDPSVFTTASTISISGLSPDKSNTLRIEALETDDVVAGSTVSTKTLETFYLDTSVLGPTSIGLYWNYTPSANYEFDSLDYAIEYGVVGENHGIQKEINDDGSVMYMLDNLTPGTNYYVQVIAYQENNLLFDTPLAVSNIREFTTSN